MPKCTLPHSITIKPDGIHELEPCVYETVEKYHNVTVEVRRCKQCGNVDIAWFRQNDTEEVDIDDE